MHLQYLGLSVKVIHRKAKCSIAKIVSAAILIVLLVDTSGSIEEELRSLEVNRSRPRWWVVVRLWIFRLMYTWLAQVSFHLASPSWRLYYSVRQHYWKLCHLRWWSPQVVPWHLSIAYSIAPFATILPPTPPVRSETDPLAEAASYMQMNSLFQPGSDCCWPLAVSSLHVMLLYYCIHF